MKKITKRIDCYDLYVKILRHCEKTQSRFGIFDVIPEKDETPEDTFLEFRNRIGSDALKYGAAYYPWLNTSIVNDSEVSFTNLNMDWNDLEFILPEAAVAKVLSEWEAPAETDDDETKAGKNKTLHQSLLASSIIYTQIMAEVKNKLNLLPPAAAMAGIYSLVDSTRGVWKAPANIFYFQWLIRRQ